MVPRDVFTYGWARSVMEVVMRHQLLNQDNGGGAGFCFRRADGFRWISCRSGAPVPGRGGLVRIDPE